MKKRTVGIILMWLCVACAGDDGKKNKGGYDEVGATNPVKAREILHAGEAFMKRGEYDKARLLYTDAAVYADVKVRGEIATMREVTDEEEAKDLSNDIVNAAESDECAKALTATVSLLKKSPGVAKFLRIHTDEGHHDCLVRLLKKEDGLTEGRKLILSSDAKKVLLPKTFKKLRKRVIKLTTQLVAGEVNAHIEAKEWKKALAAIDALVKSGKAGEEEKAEIVKQVQGGLVAAISAMHRKAMGDKEASKATLAGFDGLVALGWPGDAKKPPAMLRKRLELSFWLVCKSIKCDASRVSKRWAYGHFNTTPLLEPTGDASKEQIKSGTLVWEIARSKTWSLICAKDPGKLSDIGARAHVAAGWVRSGSLKGEDTSEWLPPGDSLIGTRVWGPLRKKQKHLELGIVTKVKGGRVTVRRLTDHQHIEVARSSVHFGLTKKGTKVLGYCTKLTKLEPALVLDVKETKFAQQGDPLVTLTCIDAKGKPTGKTKEGQLASIRIKRAWLPRRR